MKVKFIESNDSPIGLLEVNHEYELEKMDIHDSHSYIYLNEFPNKRFNSVWFEWGKNSNFSEIPEELIIKSY